ncbi:Sal-like protein 4 [Armadillidium vulgare]|nr:Sal-like protein 4 [Armadillidium vulgare]
MGEMSNFVKSQPLLAEDMEPTNAKISNENSHRHRRVLLSQNKNGNTGRRIPILPSGNFFSCSLCPLTFGSRANLRRHILIHTGEKPFQCPRCAKRFSQKVNLKYHLNKKVKCYV